MICYMPTDYHRESRSNLHALSIPSNLARASTYRQERTEPLLYGHLWCIDMSKQRNTVRTRDGERRVRTWRGWRPVLSSRACRLRSSSASLLLPSAESEAAWGSPSLLVFSASLFSGDSSIFGNALHLVEWSKAQASDLLSRCKLPSKPEEEKARQWAHSARCAEFFSSCRWPRSGRGTAQLLLRPMGPTIIPAHGLTASGLLTTERYETQEA